MTLSVVVTLTSLARAIVAPLLAAYFSRFFIHIITSMFYHLHVLSVTCCGMSSRLIIKRRYTHILYLCMYECMYVCMYVFTYLLKTYYYIPESMGNCCQIFLETMKTWTVYLSLFPDEVSSFAG